MHEVCALLHATVSHKDNEAIMGRWEPLQASPLGRAYQSDMKSVSSHRVVSCGAIKKRMNHARYTFVVIGFLQGDL